MPDAPPPRTKPSLWQRMSPAAKAVSGVVATGAALVTILATLGVFEDKSKGPPPPAPVPTEEGPSRASWARAANKACRQQLEEYAALPIATLMNQPNVTLEQLQQILDSWPALMAAVERKQAAIQRAPRPSADQASIERMLTLWDQAGTSLTRAGDAGRAGNWQLYGQLYADGGSVSERANEIARQLGATECRGL